MSKRKSKGKTKKISFELLRILVPMIALFIIAVALIIFVNSRAVIIDGGKTGLKNESMSNANDISSTIGNIKGYYNGLADAIETSSYENDKALFAAIAPGMEEYKDVVIDCYIAFSDKSFFDGGGWVPDADYDPTTRGWYETGKDSTEIVLGAPSVDMTTGQMVVCGSRSMKMKDGREGVMSTDIVLSGISETVSQYKPSGTGSSMLLSGSTIVASPEADYVGTDVSEHSSDAFLQEVYSKASAGAGEVATIKGNSGGDYFVSLDNVDGTDWILVSYVKKNDVLKEL